MVIHGIIMIVSFAELSLWAGHCDKWLCTSPSGLATTPEVSPFSKRGVSATERQSNLPKET